MSGGRYAIVVGVDYDETGEAAVHQALKLAAAREGAEVHLIHVITGGAAHSNSAASIALNAKALEEAPRRLAVYATLSCDAVPEAKGRKIALHTRFGSPAEAIVQLSVDVQAELIVVGTHGRRGVKKLALGSVAERLVEIARCPVLVTRPVSYAGTEVTPHVEPVCPGCAAARLASSNEQLWCEYHRRPQVRVHGYSSREVFAVGGHDPGVIYATP